MKQAQRRDATKYRWADISEEELNPLLTRKLITGEQVMLSFLQYEFGEHHLFAGDEFSSQQGIKFFLGDVRPAILCCIPALCLFHTCYFFLVLLPFLLSS